MQNSYFCLNSSATLNIYIQSRNSKINSRDSYTKQDLNYSKLYNILIQKLKSNISHTTFNKYINSLLKKEIIKKREIKDSNKKIPSTIYSLTTKGKMDNNLKILEIQHSINKNRILYQLLLFFEYYKRSNIITERQFKYFLKKNWNKF